jgi:hypothetical protein
MTSTQPCGPVSTLTVLRTRLPAGSSHDAFSSRATEPDGGNGFVRALPDPMREHGC